MMMFVHDLEVYKTPAQKYIFVRGCCWASYSKDHKYKVKLLVQNSSAQKVKSATCNRQCPASKSECCCHVMTVIWKLEDMTRKGKLKHAVSCTSKPQQWGKGGKREVEFHPVMATSIERRRHASDVSSKRKRKRRIHSHFYDPRPSKARHIDSDSVAKLKNNLCAINAKIPFAIMLPDNPTDLPTVNTLIGPVAKGSILHTQLKRFDTTTVNNNVQPTSTSSILHSSQLNKVNDQSQHSEKIIRSALHHNKSKSTAVKSV